MALHRDFPESPHAILDPAVRWFPADEALRESSMEKLMPPLVADLRRRVKEFRDGGYAGATDTSRSLPEQTLGRGPRKMYPGDIEEYVNADGDISNYFPDFIVRLTDGRVVIAETKGREDLDVPLKMARLRQWCEDVNHAQPGVKYDFVYVDEESFEQFHPTSFLQLMDGFVEYKGA